MLPDPSSTLDPKDLGERLRRARRAGGYTQEQAAAALEYARTTIMAIEKGGRRVTHEGPLQLVRHYGCSAAEFVSTPSAWRSITPAMS